MKYLILSLFFVTSSVSAEMLKKEYHGFTVWVDCDKGGALTAYYPATKDTANYSRDGLNFKFDSTVPSNCQPRKTRSYRTNTVPIAQTGTYDIGHLVPVNHLDYNKQAVSDSFYVTNTLPQQSNFNQQGAWAYTERMTECYRDLGALNVWAGVIWGNDTSDDFFLNTHGIATPDYWWKVVAKADTGEYVAWIMPNNKYSTSKKINNYLVSIKELISSGAYVPGVVKAIDPKLLDVRPSHSWPVKLIGDHMLECGDKFRTSMG